MIRQFYYHSKPRKGKKRFTVAAVVNGDNIVIGISACSHKDAFKKKIGRDIALGRANAKPSTSIAIESNASQGLAFRQLAKSTVELLEKKETRVYNGVIINNH